MVGSCYGSGRTSSYTAGSPRARLGRPLAVTAYRLSPPADSGRLVRGRERVGRAARRSDGARFRPDELAARDAAQRLCAAIQSADPSYPAHVHAIVDCEHGQASVEGSMAMPRAPVLEHDPRRLRGGAAEYSFRAAPAEGGGNIGAVDPGARGLRLYPKGGDPGGRAPRPGRPLGPRAGGVRSCLEQGRAPVDGGRAGAARSPCLARREPVARQRQARRSDGRPRAGAVTDRRADRADGRAAPGSSP
jgi:hypothetical protein